MTHVVHPYAHRLGTIRDWRARWFSRNQRDYARMVQVDTKVRAFLARELKGTLVGDIESELTQGQYRIVVHTARPGMVIGRGGERINELRERLTSFLRRIGVDDLTPRLEVQEIRNPESHAAVVAQMVAEQLERRLPFRRVLKQMADKVMASREVEGVRILLRGRIGGAEMKRKEEIRRGRVPLTTIRADINYGRAEAYLPYVGLTGVKVWIYRGEVFEHEGVRRERTQQQAW